MEDVCEELGYSLDVCLRFGYVGKLEVSAAIAGGKVEISAGEYLVSENCEYILGTLHLIASYFFNIQLFTIIYGVY